MGKALPSKKLTSSKIKSPNLAQKVKELNPKVKPKGPKYKDNLINRLREDWSKPMGKGQYDEYPYGSLTGRGKSKKKKKK